ncbi:Hypothetical predicted protein [Pelobates cultripes]|uniref:Uncharacterized protein n=1 Tax=Pelobates cultripes TaxID=61616 RepID=A0AAD1R8J3_PELCU|nr:Hypothetical predicted protein [Pelobates cultripes]CAH2246742.1 Hypothetical predicted protein [Pelobates cultripes]
MADSDATNSLPTTKPTDQHWRRARRGPYQTPTPAYRYLYLDTMGCKAPHPYSPTDRVLWTRRSEDTLIEMRLRNTVERLGTPRGSPPSLGTGCLSTNDDPSSSGRKAAKECTAELTTALKDNSLAILADTWTSL